MALNVRQTNGTSGNSPLSTPWSGAFTAGDAEIIANVLGGSATPAITDSINGTIANVLSYHAPTPNKQYSGYLLPSAAAGTPTLTTTQGTSFVATAGLDVYGFAGTATFDGNFNGGTFFSGSSTTAVSATIASNYNNEILVAIFSSDSGGFLSSGPSGWTAFGSGLAAYYVIVGTGGTSANFIATNSVSTNWELTVFGVYDLLVAGISVAWLS